MRFGRRRRDTPAARLLTAAGFVGGSAGQSASDVSRDVAFVVMRPGSTTALPTMSAVEEMLADEAAYDFVMTFLEQVQNVVSHGLETFLGPADVERLLGPRGAVCWNTLAEFWTAVAGWCADNRPPLESSERILSVENEQLRAILWTGNRTLPTGAKLGLADAVRYEKATGAGIPGFSHIASALRATGQG
jgi:hypothetical protein